MRRPLGYCLRSMNVREGDPELVELLKRVQIERLEHISSDNKLALIDAARRLFGDFDAFVDYKSFWLNIKY